MSQRTERIDELLRQEIGAILTRELKDPAIGFATITQVETAPDLRHARVWVSVIGQAGERDATLAALQRAMPFVRRELGARLRLKRIPELHVRLDDSIERGTRVLHLLDQLEAGEVPDEVATGESLPTPTPRLRQPGDAPEPEPGPGPGGNGEPGARPTPIVPAGRRRTGGAGAPRSGPSRRRRPGPRPRAGRHAGR